MSGGRPDCQQEYLETPLQLQTTESQQFMKRWKNDRKEGQPSAKQRIVHHRSTLEQAGSTVD